MQHPPALPKHSPIDAPCPSAFSGHRGRCCMAPCRRYQRLAAASAQTEATQASVSEGSSSTSSSSNASGEASGAGHAAPVAPPAPTFELGSGAGGNRNGEGAAGFLAAVLEGSSNSSRLDAKLAVGLGREVGWRLECLTLLRWLLYLACCANRVGSRRKREPGAQPVVPACSPGPWSINSRDCNRLVGPQVWSTLWQPLLPPHWLRAVLAAGGLGWVGRIE